LGKFTHIEALFDLLRLQHQVSVDVDCIWIEPGDVFAVCNSAKHIVIVIPAERVNHITDLMNLGLVNKGQEHIAVVVHEAHLALA